ncbi:YxeA family protein [Hoyosella rhizosphaerae]|uniref:YxeA family protein n=1 Tax=Hoyosella rhizosphaerae TaxID=1755582 RepID=A0A916U0I6_9ACTN|nr:YxeA family protein [Hoyosella rhizosphaerae]MBN4926913.1 YxeA family protein [Hoyosella rhizosphaerae]GGC55542.1 hypothetical protein GCM10011410_04900 [Hoyosella rhizosphaerae]
MKRNRRRNTFRVVMALAVVAVAITGLMLSRYNISTVDRFNPLVSSTESYVLVEPGAREVRNADPVDELGANRPYTLDFTAWGTEDTVIKVRHKGTYVSSIEYPEQGDIPEATRMKLDREAGEES